MNSNVKPRFGQVLLIDEDELDNFIHERMITSSNFSENVCVRNSGIRALEYLKEKVNDPEQMPEVIFLDIMMPVMDGFQFLEEYEKLPDDFKDRCRVIMLSSSQSFKDLNRANSNKNVYKFLNKPLSEKALEAIR